MKMNALTAIDFYKSSHGKQYPEGTEYVYSNFTPRTGKYSNAPSINGVVNFGLQGFIKWFLIDMWNDTFFSKPLDEVITKYKRRMDNALGKNAVDMDHIVKLHKLGYMPVKIKALPEGALVPYGVPLLTIINTDPEFGWVTNYLESVMSAELWRPMTSATLALAYRKRFEAHARKTGSPADFVQFQGHDFSFRGMGGMYDAAASGAGHLTAFSGTDTVPAIDYLEEYYGADSDKELVGVSVPATEHSVQCMGGKETEIDTFRRLINDIFPAGIVSIVSDTWDLWEVMTKFLPELHDDIMARDGRLVIRPDSGDPVDIICGKTEGYPSQEEYEFASGSPEFKGVYELLWDEFGGTINDKGYKVLDTHVGAIYGDSITLDRQDDILKRLEAKGFCASNLVLGIGSYSYVYSTRDTHGFAMKATWGQVNGEGREIFKDPITDDGMKKSAKGLLQVFSETPEWDAPVEYRLIDQVSKDEEAKGDLEVVFENGNLVKETTLAEIRARVSSL